MAITINWPTGIISIPRNDLTLVQSSPNEIRQLDLNSFRLTLKSLEASPEGLTWTITHVHNPPFDVGTVELARSVKILEPYTITFEDGQYAVNITGGNTNLADRVNVNQVSVRPSNSAGLATSAAIEFGEYNGGVTIDIDNTTGRAESGAGYPIGTLRRPSNNMFDTVQIANFRGFSTIYAIKNLTLDIDAALNNKRIIGESPILSYITINPISDTQGMEINNATVTGTLDGENTVKDCIIEGMTYLNGSVISCGLRGTITLSGGASAIFNDCYCASDNDCPEIDLGGSGQSLHLRDYHGGIRLSNLNNSSDKITVAMGSGIIYLESTLTAGTVEIYGVAEVVDNSNGATIINEALNDNRIADSVWDEVLTGATHNIPSSAGRRLRDITSNVVLSDEILSATENTVTLNSESSNDDGAYDPGIISIVEGTGSGQSRLILEYDGTTHTAVVDRNWKIIPDATSKCVIVSATGREHVNEGLARGSGSGNNTIILNELASPYDDAYIGQTIFIRSGTGQDQACKINSYNGTTKEVTITKDWWELPDTTSAYVILPTGVLGNTFIANSVWDEDITTHTEINSAGEKQNQISTSSDIAAAVWSSVDSAGISFEDAVLIMRRMLENDVTRSGDIITIYEEDGVTIWRQYDLSGEGRVEV